MRKLEIYVNEKLKVTNNIYVPDLSALLNSKNIREFNSRCEQLSEYLKNDSDSHIAELKYSKDGHKKLSKNTKILMIHFCGLKAIGAFFMVHGIQHILYAGLELIILLNVMTRAYTDSRSSYSMIMSYLNLEEYTS